jgi:PAS domain S-box-containing protein
MGWEMILSRRGFRYLVAVLAVVAATAVRMGFLQALGMRIPFVTFYPAVMLAALVGGLPAGLLATALSALLASFFWIEPVNQLFIRDPADWLGIIVFIMSCLIISFMSEAMRRAQTRAKEAESLASLAVERENAARTLKNERARLQTLVQTIPDLIWLKDPEGAYLSCNRMFERLYGATEKEIVGKTDHDFVDAELADFFREKDRAAMAAGVPSINEEWVTFAEDGHRALLETIKTPMHDTDGRLIGVLGIARDITARNRAEKDLLASEQRYHSLFENMQEGFAYCRMLFDEDNLPEDFVYLNVNNAFTRVIGLNDVVGKRVTEVIPGIKELSPELFEIYGRVAMTGQPERFEFDFKSFSTWLSISVYSPEKGYFVAVFEDITERKQAEESIRMLTQAVNQSPVSIVLTDINGTIKFVNPKFTQLTGFAKEEALGQNPRILKSGLTPTAVYDNLWATITSGNVWNGEFQTKKKNGELFWEHATISPILHNNGDITHFMAIKEDITERKHLEEQLLQSQKMEAIGKLAGGVAHDFNNILTAIICYSTLLDMKMDDDDPQKLNVGQILAAANRAADLTRSLLAFSRKQIINTQPINLNQVIRNTEKFLQRIIGEDISLKTAFHQDVLTVNADSGQIEQVLMNLATNSRDAMPTGGMLSIETDCVGIDTEFITAHGYGKQGEYALISVNDTGLGMTENTRKRLFEPFFTTKEVGKGTGLGLSIVYGIIKQHNGFINVYSEPGVGTTFTVYLPLIRAAVEEKTEVVDEIPQGGTETILVADDDTSLRELADKLFSQFGYTVITAEDGQDALVKFSENKDKIALVILDVIMPKMNGKETREAIWKIRPDSKVLLFSGYTADIMHTRGMLDDGVEFIAKPLSPVKLLRKVREVLDRAN